MGRSLKRERRPNVRLEEIGDLPAAVSFVHKVRVDLRKRRWICDGEKTDVNAAGITFDSGVNSCAVTDLACLGSVKLENCSNGDMQQNIENTNPNSGKPGFGHSTSVGVGLGKAKVEFSNVTKKRRVMKRRPQTSNSGNGSFGSAWNSSRLGSHDSDDNIKKHTKATHQFNSFGSSDIYPVIWSTGHSGPELSTTSKQDSEDYLIKHPLGVSITNKSNSDEFAHHTDNEQMSKDKGMFLYGVDKWLEERGFGNYVELFETHEVDEEALPLLTFEDLKEMGVDAVGPRRKLYNAIRQLRGTTDY